MTAHARPAWLMQRERGSALLMATIMRIALHLGRPAGALLLYPICAYFLLFSVAARRASSAYLARVLRRPARWREIFRHYHCFAATLLDRVFLHAGRAREFQCEWAGLDALRAQLAVGRGCLLVGAHFGSFEVLRALALIECPVPVRVLMHATHAAKMARVLERLCPDLARQVIPLGRPQTMLEVRAALSAGEIVALLADRSMQGDRLVACDFLGGVAGFPRGPFELAAMLRAPVLLFCATYRGPRRYEVRFDRLLADANEATATSSASDGDDAPARGGASEPPAAARVRLRAAQARDAVALQCRGYARWLETRCRADPYNWFNFFDFWSLRGEREDRP